MCMHTELVAHLEFYSKDASPIYLARLKNYARVNDKGEEE